MGCQKSLFLCAPIFLTYFWRSRWCVSPSVILSNGKNLIEEIENRTAIKNPTRKWIIQLENGNKSALKNCKDKPINKMEIVLPKRALYDINSCTCIHTSRQKPYLLHKHRKWFHGTWIPLGYLYIVHSSFIRYTRELSSTSNVPAAAGYTYKSTDYGLR